MTEQGKREYSMEIGRKILAHPEQYTIREIGDVVKDIESGIFILIHEIARRGKEHNHGSQGTV